MRRTRTTPFAPALTLSLLLAACADPGAPAAPAAVAAPALAKGAFPASIALPVGFGPEGIAFGRGGTFYVGSIATGQVVRGDAATGEVTTLVAARPDREASGMKVDEKNRLFVAGGLLGQAYVYDAATGATLAVFQLTAPFGGLINDVVLTKDAAYFTDSFRPVLYRLAIAPNGALGAVTEIALGGDWVSVPGQLNGNGIVATPDGGTLLLVNSTTGALYRLAAGSGDARAVPVDGGPLVGGDGMLLDGRTLYVVQGVFQRIAVVRLASDLTSGAVARTITSPAFRFPSTIGEHGGALYAVNARFDLAPPPAPAPAIGFEVVRVDK